VLAAGYDLKVFFSVVSKPREEVAPADVLAFITAQRSGVHGVLQPVDRDDASASWLRVIGPSRSWKRPHRVPRTRNISGGSGVA
jgi:hypothetical protein